MLRERTVIGEDGGLEKVDNLLDNRSGELSSESLEEFLDIKYNEDAWNKLKNKPSIFKRLNK